MPINVGNFIRGTLRAPLGVTDTVLQLAPGTGGQFNMPVGDYVFITLYDRVSYEIVRYTSTGPVVGDNITVTRGQDGTVARAFPAGTCYEVAWNEQQVIDFVNLLIQNYLVTTPLPSDTQTIGAGVPVGAPIGNVRYTVNLTTGELWFWTGTTWLPIGGGVTPFPPEYQYLRRRFIGAQSFASGTIATATYNQPDSLVLRNGATALLASVGLNSIAVSSTAVIRVSGQIELDSFNSYTRYAGFFTFAPAPSDIIAVQSEAFYVPGGTDNSLRINVVSPPVLVVGGTIVSMQVEDTGGIVPNNTIVSAQLTVEIVSE